MLQIGDNDSGRFFRLTPIGQFLIAQQALARYETLEQIATPDPYFDEDLNCPDALLAAISGLFDRPMRWMKKDCLIEKCLLKGIACCALPAECTKPLVPVMLPQKPSALAHHCDWQLDFSGEPLTTNLQLMYWPDFGVYVYRSDRMLLCINGCSNGQRGHNGHSHNDRLSFELWIDKKPITVDPGTFVYTASLGWRNYFRSTECHTVVNDGTTQNQVIGPFAMKGDTSVRLLELTENSITLECVAKRHRQRRQIMIEQQALRFEDESDQPLLPPNIGNIWITAGYGKLLRRGRDNSACENGYSVNGKEIMWGN